MINKKLTRVTEADLHRIVKESVNNILTEGNGRAIDESYKKTTLRLKYLGFPIYYCIFATKKNDYKRGCTKILEPIS